MPFILFAGGILWLIWYLIKGARRSLIKRGIVAALFAWFVIGVWWVATNDAAVDRFAAWFIYDVLEKG